MIGFWNRLLTSSDKKYSFQIYSFMLNHNGNTYKWLTYIKSIFDNLWWSAMWLNQAQLRSKDIKYTVKRVLLDQFLQNWHSNMQNSNKGIAYWT